jgi:hypothetical protein
MPTWRGWVDGLDVVAQFDAVDHQRAFLVLFQAVDAADQRALARARRAADDDALALGHLRSMSRSTWKLPYHLLTLVNSMMGWPAWS